LQIHNGRTSPTGEHKSISLQFGRMRGYLREPKKGNLVLLIEGHIEKLMGIAIILGESSWRFSIKRR